MKKEFKKNKACFLDRDGVLIEEKNYLSSPADVTIFPETIQALRILRKNDFKIIVITNQGGVAKGYYKEESILDVHKEIDRQLAKVKLKIDKYYYCPHHPEGTVKRYSIACKCRKPSPGLILDAVKEFGIELNKSFLIGDKVSDIEAAQNAGCLAILVKTGHGRDHISKTITKNIIVAENILEAVKLLTNSTLD